MIFEGALCGSWRVAEAKTPCEIKMRSFCQELIGPDGASVAVSLAMWKVVFRGAEEGPSPWPHEDPALLQTSSFASKVVEHWTVMDDDLAEARSVKR